MDSHSRSASPREQLRPQHRPPSPPTPTAFENQGFQRDDADPNHNESLTSTSPQQNGHNKETNGDTKTLEAVNLELINLTPKNGSSKPKKEVEVDMNGSNPYDEYFVPVNEHRKYMRGEKLYVTADKRGEKGGCKRPLCWTLLGLIVAAIIALIILAATGVLFASSPTPVNPYNATVSSARALGGIGQAVNHEHEHETNHDQDHETNHDHDHENEHNQDQVHDHGPEREPEERHSGTIQGQVVPDTQNDESLPGSEESSAMYIPRTLEGELKIDNHDFLTAYQDPESEEFQEFAESFSNALKRTLFDRETLDKGDSDINVAVVELRPGSILVTYRISWKPKGNSMPSEDLLTMKSLQTNLNDYLNKNNRMISIYHIADDKMAERRVLDLCQMNKNECEYGCEFEEVTLEFTCTCPHGQITDIQNPKKCISYLSQPDFSEGTLNEDKKHNDFHVLAIDSSTTTPKPAIQVLPTENNNGFQWHDRPVSTQDSTTEVNPEFTFSHVFEHSSESDISIENTTQIEPENPEPEPEANPEPNSDIAHEIDPVAKPEPTPEPEPEAKPEPTPEPEPEVKPEPTPEPEPEVKPEPTPEPEPKTESEPEPTPEPSLQPEPEPQLTIKPVSIVRSHDEMHSELADVQNTVLDNHPTAEPEVSTIPRTNEGDYLLVTPISSMATVELTEPMDPKTESPIYTEKDDSFNLHDTLKSQAKIESDESPVTESNSNLKTKMLSLPVLSEQSATEASFLTTLTSEIASNSSVIAPVYIKETEPKSESEESSYYISSFEGKKNPSYSDENKYDSNSNDETKDFLFDEESKIPLSDILNEPDKNLSHEIIQNTTTANGLSNETGSHEVDDWLYAPLNSFDYISGKRDNIHETDKLANSTGSDLSQNIEQKTESQHKPLDETSLTKSATIKSNKLSTDVMFSVMHDEYKTVTENKFEKEDSVTTLPSMYPETQYEYKNEKASEFEKRPDFNKVTNTSLENDESLTERSNIFTSIIDEATMMSSNISHKNSQTEITTQAQPVTGYSIRNHYVPQKQDLIEILEMKNQTTLNETMPTEKADQAYQTELPDDGSYVTFDAINKLFNRSSKSIENDNATSKINDNLEGNQNDIENLQTDSDWLTHPVTEVDYKEAINKMHKYETTESSGQKLDDFVNHNSKDDFEPDYLSHNNNKMSAEEPMYSMIHDYDNEDSRVKRVNKDSKEIKDSHTKNLTQTITTESSPVTSIFNYVNKTMEKDINHTNESTILFKPEPAPVWEESESKTGESDTKPKEITTILPNTSASAATTEAPMPITTDQGTLLDPTILLLKETYNNITNLSTKSPELDQNKNQKTNFDIKIYELPQSGTNHSVSSSKSTNTPSTEYEDHEVEMNPFLPETENNKNLVKKLQDGHEYEPANLNETQNENFEEHGINTTDSHSANNGTLAMLTKEKGQEEQMTKNISSSFIMNISQEIDRYTTEKLNYMSTSDANKNLVKKLQDSHEYEPANLNKTQNENIEEHGKNRTDSHSANNGTLATLTKEKGQEEQINYMSTSEATAPTVPISTFLLDTDDLDVPKKHKEQNVNVIDTSNHNDINLTPTSTSFNADNIEYLRVVPIEHDLSDIVSSKPFKSDLNDINDVSNKDEKRTLDLRKFDSVINNVA